MITPELAAHVVKNHVLPMFKKRGSDKNYVDNKTVYGELKLSDKLATELQMCKNDLQALRELFDETNYEKNLLQEQLTQT